jgi:hypothetical protein
MGSGHAWSRNCLSNPDILDLVGGAGIMTMRCIICGEDADKMSIYVPGDKTRLIVGNAPEGKTRSVIFGICSIHLNEEGDFLEGIADQVKKNILSKVREPNVPHLNDTDLSDENWEEQKP